MYRVADILIQALRDTLALLPYVALAVAIMVLATAAIKLMNGLIRWLIRVSNLEGVLKSVLPTGTRLPLTSLIIVVADVTVFSLFMVLSVRMLATVSPNLYEGAVLYISRVASIIIMLLVLLVSLDVIAGVVSLEEKTKSLFYILTFFLGMSMVVDLTVLSPEMKSSLSLGIAIGVGLSLGVFTLWLLFGERVVRCSEAKDPA